jgi:Lipopolysaccharide-assembly
MNKRRPQARRAKRRSAALLSATLGAAWLAAAIGCSAYRIGNATLYPTDIHTVYVPIFESDSFRRHLGERLTEAVQKEIELKTPYKVVGSPGSDSVLTGRIVGETKRLVGVAPTDDVREAQVNLQVQLQWVDRQGTALRSMPPIPLPNEVALVGQAATLVPEYGQSTTSGQEEAIHRLAEQIVGLMEAPW